MPVSLVPSANGILLPVRAQPRAKRSGIVGVHGGRLKVAVTQPPEKGKANEAIAAVLAEALDVKRARIALHGGAGSPRKTFLIAGLDEAELRRRIAAALAE
ncbi:MAG: DUF167 domain-containing protein [Planctomycetaceae bacterium]